MPNDSNQNADDKTCRPAIFHRSDCDGIETTFRIQGDWQLVGTKKLGEMVVRETLNGPLVKIEVEPEV